MSHVRGTQPPVYALKAEFFKTLGHPARIRILQLLRDGELSVGSLQTTLDLDSSSTSQLLAALRKQGLVSSRRDGTTIYYRLKDERTLALLALAREIISSNLEESRSLLDDFAGEELEPKRSPA